MSSEIYTFLAPDGRHEERIYALAPDGRSFVFLRDDGGNDLGHFVRVPLDGSTPHDLTPDLVSYMSFAFFFNSAGTRMGFTATIPDIGFRMYLIDTTSDDMAGQPMLIQSSEHLIVGPWLSVDPNLAIIASGERMIAPNVSLIAFDLPTRQRINELWEAPTISFGLPPLFSPLPADERLLTTIDRPEGKRPIIWEPRTGQRVDIPVNDDLSDVTPLCWSPDGTRILLAQVRDAQQQLSIYDIANRQIRLLNHPGGTYQGFHWQRNDEILALWQDSEHPPEVVAINGETRHQQTLLRTEDLPSGHPWQSVYFPSSDGQMVQSWVAVPEGHGRFPLVIEAHGGPRGVTTNTYRPDSQAWLDHGFAFMSVNYRGSTTFGSSFRDKIEGNPGHWELEDLIAART